MTPCSRFLCLSLMLLGIGNASPMWAQQAPSKNAAVVPVQSSDTLSGSAQALSPQPVASDTELTPVQLNDPANHVIQTSVVKGNNYPIDLQTILRLVEDQNLVIAQGQKNTEVLQSRLRQRQASILPNIEGTYNQSKLEGGQQVFGDVVTVVRTTTQPQIGVSWTLYPGGQTIFEILAAKRRKQSADSLYQGTYQQQLSLAAQDYYKLLASHQQKNVSLRSIEQASEQVKSNEAMVAVGRGIPLDLSRAKTNYAQQKTTLIQAENAIIQAEQSLLNRLNLDSDIHLLPSDAQAVKKPLLPAAITVAQFVEQAILANPQLKTSEEELKALGYDYKAVRSNLIPSVTLRTYVNRTGPDWSNQLRTNFTGMTINVNLLENLGLQIPFQMQERKKLIEQKLLEQKQLVRDIESSVMTAFLNSENYKSVIESAELEVASAQESYELASGRFNAGYGINLDVLDAQAVLVTSQNNLLQAVLNYNQSQIQLVEAIGLVAPDTLEQGIQWPAAVAKKAD